LNGECHDILQVSNKLINVVQNLELFIHAAKDKSFETWRCFKTPVSALFRLRTLKTTHNNQETN
jgi:hypothetical protein